MGLRCATRGCRLNCWVCHGPSTHGHVAELSGGCACAPMPKWALCSCKDLMQEALLPDVSIVLGRNATMCEFHMSS